MKIILDTTVFVADRSMKSPAWRTFAEARQRIPSVELLVPEIVLDEAVNSFREDLEAAWAASDRATQDVDRILGRPPLNPADRDLGQDAETYRQRVLERIREIGGRFLPYPRVDHRDLVHRDLERRKPFDKDGRGYRDALIWESIREHLSKGVDSVVLVSGNKRDFGDGLLHQELSRDVEYPRHVRVVKSLGALNEELISPKLAMLDIVREALEFSRALAFDPATWLETSPLRLLRDHVEDLAPLVAGFPSGVGVALPAAVLEADDFRVRRMQELSEREVHLRVEFRLLARMIVQWTGEEARTHPEVREFLDVPMLHTTAKRDIPAEFRMGVDLVVYREDMRVGSEALGFLRGEHGTRDYGGWADEPRRGGDPAANVPTAGSETSSAAATVHP